MNFLRALAAIGLGIAITASLMLLALNNPLWPWGTGLAMFFFCMATYLKAIHLGTGTLRGKFHIILGSGGAVFTAGILAGLFGSDPLLLFGLHDLGRVVLIFALILMLLGLMKQGYTLSAMEWGQVVLVFLVLAGIGLGLFYGLYSGATPLMIVLVYLSLILLFVTVAVVRVYLGSSLGARWTLGALSVLFITFGDMAMAYQAMSGIEWWTYVQYLSWSMLAIIMGIISSMWD
ncbi:MAG: hypothetical protein EHM45_00570 [Desulfobacteraceae bacterium]|nr:MAG: hypothetical protein EHM45_00570 [Desulfobacteraceae bacterium]